jgi:hypothetical protein
MPMGVVTYLSKLQQQQQAEQAAACAPVRFIWMQFAIKVNGHFVRMVV